MSGKLWSIVSAAITLLMFTLIPLYAPSLLPSELDTTLSNSGLDLAGLTKQIATIGVVTSVLMLVRGFVEPSSPVHLVASIASSLVTLALTTLTLSLGDWRNLGINIVSMEVQGVENTVVIDLRLFIQLAALSMALQAVHSVLKFVDARRERSPPLTEIEPPIPLTEIEIPIS